MNWVKLGTFVGGVVFGTVGLDILKSKDAKKVYTHVTAAGIRAKDQVMATYTMAKENIDDIYHDALEINAAREAEAAQAAVIEDAAEA